MVYLLKVLSDIAPKPSSTFSIQICTHPNSKLGPPDSFYPEPPSSVDIAFAKNPSLFGLTDRDLGLTEMGLQPLCFPLKRFGPTEMSDRSHRDCNANSLFPFRNVLVLTRERIGPTEIA